MEIIKTITINLTTDEIKEMIVEYLRGKGYTATNDDINFVIDTEVKTYYDNQYGESEYRTSYLKNACVKINF